MKLLNKDKNHILLISREEYDKIESDYKSIEKLYRAVADHIFHLAENCRKYNLTDQIRIVKERPGIIKKEDTIKTKILKSRADGWGNGINKLKKYNFSSVKDIIGIKIICGYLSDQPTIEKWIRKTFIVKDDDFVSYIGGYISWHYIVQLRRPHINSQNLPKEWGSVPCEIQVKTLLQAAWDDKTHDIVYKQEDIFDFDREQFALLSQSLHVADKQSELIRLQIEDSLKEEQQRREAALRAYYHESSEKIAKELGYQNIEAILKVDAQDIIKKLEVKKKKIRKDKGKSNFRLEKLDLLTFGVRFTLETLYEDAKKWVLDYMEQLIHEYPRDCYTARVVSAAYWALGCEYESLEAVVRAIENADAQKDKDCKNDAMIALVHFIADYGREDLKELGKQLLGEIKDDAQGLETKGFFMIKMAKTKAEIEKGIEFLHQSIHIAEESGDTQLCKIAEAFCDLDHSIAARKFKGLELLKIADLIKKADMARSKK